MALIKPFQGYHYNYKLLKDKNSLFVPPYDVISKSELKAFRKINPHNYIHITLAEPKGEKDPYSSVRKKLQQWIKNQILVQDDTPSLYFYTMEYDSNPDLQLSTLTRKTRKILSGFISLVKLESYETGKVIPHEVTFAAPRTDRMNLLASAQAHLEPVYCLYEDKKALVQSAFLKSIQHQKPLIMVKDSKSTTHRFWKIDQPDLLSKVTQLMAKKSLLIADGHHRYGAALQYREHLLSTGQQLPEDHPSDYIMMFLANMDDKELFIAPTHRMFKNIPEKVHAALLDNINQDFKVYPSPETSMVKSQQWFLNKLSKYSPRKPVFGLYNGEFYLLEYHKSSMGELKLDTEILQEKVIQQILQLNDATQIYKHLGFSHSLQETIQNVDQQKYQGAFILRAPDIHDVKKICSSNRMMPQKSTYFFPKPLSGLVLSVF